MKSTKNISIKYFDEMIPHLIHENDWVDLRASYVAPVDFDKKITTDDRLDWDRRIIKKGATVKIYLGFACALPDDHEAIVKPRSSLFKTHGLIFTSSGVIDESYKGNDDEWFATFVATKDTVILHGERLCQFRILEKQPNLTFVEVNALDFKNRGGHGSTGRV